MLYRNDQIFSSCIRELFKVLSRWTPERQNHATKASASGIALEISAVSPNDSQHNHYSCALDDDYPVRFESDLPRITIEQLAEHHRLKCLQRRSSRQEPNAHADGISPPRPRFISSLRGRRVIGTPLRLRPTVPSLPKVPMVKSLVLRQQSYRGINVRSLAQILRQSLVALECFRFERRRPIMPSQRHLFNEGNTDCYIHPYPRRALIRRAKSRVRPVSDTFAPLDPPATVSVRVAAVSL